MSKSYLKRTLAGLALAGTLLVATPAIASADTLVYNGTQRRPPPVHQRQHRPGDHQQDLPRAARAHRLQEAEVMRRALGGAAAAVLLLIGLSAPASASTVESATLRAAAVRLEPVSPLRLRQFPFPIRTCPSRPVGALPCRAHPSGARHPSPGGAAAPRPDAGVAIPRLPLPHPASAASGTLIPRLPPAPTLTPRMARRDRKTVFHASATAAARSRLPVFMRMRATWVLTVASDGASVPDLLVGQPVGHRREDPAPAVSAPR